MTPAQSTALALPDDEHAESRVPGPTNSTAPAALHPYGSRAEDDDSDIRTAIARSIRLIVAGRSFAAPQHRDITASNSLIAQPRDELVATSFTGEPSKRESAELAPPPSVGLAKQPEYAAQSTSASEVAEARLAEAATMDDVLAVLRESGLVTLAARVAELHRRHEADPQEHPMPNTASMKRMAQVVLTNDRLRTPNRLAVNDEGFFTAEWTVGQAELVLSFWPSSHIRFAALDPIDIRGSHLRVGGLLNSSDAVNAVRWLVSRIPTT